MDSSSNPKLQVKAIDFTGNSTTISKTVQIFDWALPVINLSAKRTSNYKDETKLKANVETSSAKKLNAIKILQYRTKKVNGSSWGSWTDIKNNAKKTIAIDKLSAWNL